MDKKQIEEIIENAFAKYHPYKAISNQYAEISNRLKSIDNTLKKQQETIEKHNGRLKKIEEWRAKITGGATATKFIWAVLSAFVLSGILAIFSMNNRLYVLETKFNNLEKMIQYQYTNNINK